jgi:hypothetical protein
MKTKTKCALFTILWMFVFFLCTAVAYLIVGSLFRHRSDLPRYPLLYSLMPFTPLLMAGLKPVLNFFANNTFRH